MIKHITFALAAALAMTFGAMMPASAQNFTYNANGEVDYTLDASETFEFTQTLGGNFAYNGGAGTAGAVNVEADLAATGALNAQEAGGYGSAYANNGGVNVEAGFESASYTGNFGLAFSGGFNDASLSYDGVAQAGGAGSVDIGVSTGYELSFSQDLTGSLSANYTQDLVLNP